jgi:hypothetical protein
MGSAGGYTYGHVADLETADAMHCCNARARVLRDDAVQHPAHLFVGQALVGLVVETRYRFPVGMVADHPMEDADAPCARVIDRFSSLVERDLSLCDAA